MSKLPVIGGLLVAGAAAVVLQQWDPPMAVLEHLGATPGNRPAPEEPRHQLAVRPIIRAALEDNPKFLAAQQTIDSGIEMHTDLDGLMVPFARDRAKLDAIRTGLSVDTAVGPVGTDSGPRGWLLYALGPEVLATTTDVVAARPLANVVAVDLTPAARARVKDYDTNHPGAWGAVLVDGDVAVAGHFRALAPNGILQLGVGPPLGNDATRIAARLGGAPVPIPQTAVQAARIAAALAAGFVTMVLLLIFFRR